MSKKGGMQFGSPSGLTTLLKDGYKVFSGSEEAFMRNAEACVQLAGILRTSLGPNGANKLVINHLEKLFITSDGATIVEELEVAHPAAKMLARAAKMQEQECGDGTTFVLTFAGALLSHAMDLLKIGVHPSEVLVGYRKAADKAAQLLEEMASKGPATLENPRDRAALVAALKPVLASKQLGHEDLLAGLVADACLTVMPPAPKRAAVTVDNVRVAKLLGGTLADSQIIKGVVVQRDTEGSIKHVEKAKIAVFGCSIEAAATETKGTIVIKNAEELKAYNKGEEALMEETIKGIAATGAKVVVAGGTISEIALHFIEKYGMLAVKVLSKFELRRLCKAVGATAQVRVGPPMPEELGYADTVSVQELSSRLVTVFRQDGDEDSGVATIVLRGSTTNGLDDVERAIDDAVNVAKGLCKDGRMVPGAGAAEMELAHAIAALGAATPGMEQYAINKFAEALEVVPRVLAENCGGVPDEVISALYAAHAAGKTAAGVDVEGQNPTLDAAAAGVWDCYAVKAQAFRLSVEAALTILRVDQIIMSKQAGGPKVRPQGAPDDD